MPAVEGGEVEATITLPGKNVKAEKPKKAKKQAELFPEIKEKKKSHGNRR